MYNRDKNRMTTFDYNMYGEFYLFASKYYIIIDGTGIIVHGTPNITTMNIILNGYKIPKGNPVYNLLEKMLSDIENIHSDLFKVIEINDFIEDFRKLIQ